MFLNQRFHEHDQRVMEGGHQRWLRRIRLQCHKTVAIDDKLDAFQWVAVAASVEDWFEGMVAPTDTAATAASEAFRQRVLNPAVRGGRGLLTDM